jgi:hypothetical protein
MSGDLYARWDDVLDRVREAVEGVLTDHDPAEGPLSPSQIEWAQEMAGRVADDVELHLDGWTLAEWAEETRAPGGRP